MATKLTADAVEETMKHVLFKPSEVPDGQAPGGAIKVQGLQVTFAFHPGRLAERRESIIEMLAQLPDKFHHNTGGGWSFLNGCQTKDGLQWGEQMHVDQLVCLGIAIGKAEWQMRDMANILPGGVPYFVVRS